MTTLDQVDGDTLEAERAAAYLATVTAPPRTARVFHEDDRATVWIGDALAVLRELDDNSVDALITDPPYSSGGQYRGDRAGQSANTKYVSTGSSSKDIPEFSGDNRDARSFGYWTALWLGEALRVVKPQGVTCLFTDWRQLPTTTDALQAGGWIWRGIVPWHKPANRPTAGRYSNSCEYVVWGSNGPMTTDLTAPCLPGFLSESAPRDRVHVTQKPTKVLRELVKIVPPGGTVLDLFSGSGTTGVASIMEGRRTVLAEIHEHFAGVTRDRLLTTKGLDPLTVQHSIDLDTLPLD